MSNLFDIQEYKIKSINVQDVFNIKTHTQKKILAHITVISQNMPNLYDIPQYKIKYDHISSYFTSNMPNLYDIQQQQIKSLYIDTSYLSPISTESISKRPISKRQRLVEVLIRGNIG